MLSLLSVETHTSKNVKAFFLFKTFSSKPKVDNLEVFYHKGNSKNCFYYRDIYCIRFCYHIKILIPILIFNFTLILPIKQNTSSFIINCSLLHHILTRLI